jgi:hypothetical protein
MVTLAGMPQTLYQAVFIFNIPARVIGKIALVS